MNVFDPLFIKKFYDLMQLLFFIVANHNSRITLKRNIGSRPIGHHHQTIAKSDQEENMHEQPK